LNESSTQTDGCITCHYLSNEVRQLRNLWLGAKRKLEAERDEKKGLLERIIGKCIKVVPKFAFYLTAITYEYYTHESPHITGI
jgi:hypothetical protein